MEQNPQKRLRFCPFCGEKLVIQAVVHFCPFCGRELASLLSYSQLPLGRATWRARGGWRRSHVDVKAEQASLLQSVETLESAGEVRRFCDQWLLQKQQSGWSKEEIAAQLKPALTLLREKFPEKPSRVGVKKKEEQLISEEKCYTVILKSCRDKEKLSGKLEQVLQRGRAAIQMAVHMMPSVILYKAKAEDMQDVVKVLQTEYSAVSVIEGDFTLDSAISKLFPDFVDLGLEIQDVVRRTPQTLWLGDQILAVYSEVACHGAEGILVVTNHHLYFLFINENQAEIKWKVIPLLRVAEVEVSEEYTGANLELVLKNEFEDLRFFMADFYQAEQAAKKIQESLDNLVEI